MKEIIVGKYTELSNEEYHAHTDSISRSAIMDFMQSPRKYWANYLNPNRPSKKTTEAMEFGENFHQMILEPKNFNEQTCLEIKLNELPKCGLLRDLGRDEYDRQKAHLDQVKLQNEILQTEYDVLNAGLKCIKQEDFQKMNDMRDSLQANAEAWDLLSEGKYENSYFWKDEDTDILLKARPDILHSSVIVDLKTARDASPRGFQNAMCYGGYHIQAAMILDAIKAIDGHDINTFINIVIEKEYPYAVGVYIIDTRAINLGRAKYKAALHGIKQAREKNEFLDYPAQVIELPAWYE